MKDTLKVKIRGKEQDFKVTKEVLSKNEDTSDL
jgi:hypothetical protein